MRKLAIAFLLSASLLLAACAGGAGSGNWYGGGNAGSGNQSAGAGAAGAGGTTGGAAGGTPARAPTITMGVAFFVGTTNLTIKAGQAVTFTDPASSGGTHDLVTGTHGQFTAASGAPTAFGTQDGIDFSPGMSKTITFPSAGTFKITCTIHPPMQAVITVTP